MSMEKVNYGGTNVGNIDSEEKAKRTSRKS